MGDDEGLGVLAEALEPRADGGGRGPADAAVDLVEDQRLAVALLREADLERQQEAGQFAPRGDLVDGAGQGAGVRRHLEGDPVDAVRAGALGVRLDLRAEDGAFQLERGQLAHHLPVEHRRRLLPRAAERPGGVEKGAVGGGDSLLPLGQRRLAPLDEGQLLGQPAMQARQLRDADTVLAGQRAQGKEALLGLFQPARIERERLGGALDLGQGVRAGVHRPGDGFERRVELAVRLAGGDLDPAQGIRQRALGPLVAELGDGLAHVVGDGFGALHLPPLRIEHVLLALLGGEALQLLDRMAHELGVALGGGDLRAGGLQPGRRLAPRLVERAHPAMLALQSGIGVEQPAMARRVDERAIVELAVDLDEPRAQFAQGRHADGLVVDEGAAAPLAGDDAADDERGILDLVPLLAQPGPGGVILVQLEFRRRRALVGPRAHQIGIRPRAQGRAERVEQDGFPRPRLAGHGPEACVEIEIERVDQDDVANRQTPEHGPRALSR